MIDYKLVHALAAVSEEQSFERAARRLNITQSAVSQRLKLLEEQCGQILLARTKPLKPTPAGKKILSHFQKILRLENDLWSSLAPEKQGEFSTLCLGVNEDSLNFWFLDAVKEFLRHEKIVLDIHSEDQGKTLQLLRDGEVIGCVSVKASPMQGCLVKYLGTMTYRALAAPEFAAKWFANGLDQVSLARTPLVIFNRHDELHTRFFNKRQGADPSRQAPIHYIPSADRFADFLCSGLAYGLLPDEQSQELLGTGRLVDLDPNFSLLVRLYWHCWNIQSRLLNDFTSHLTARAGRILRQ